METPSDRYPSESLQPTGPLDRVLATDLDGTLIPLPEEPRNRADLKTLSESLQQSGVTLIYVTGRHFESASRAIEQYELPAPDWLLCDVGTSLFQQASPGEFVPVTDYQQHLDRIVSPRALEALRSSLESMTGLRPQEPEKQGRFKISFYADADRLDELVGRIRIQLEQRQAPCSIVHSVDPFNGDGLIDLLPAKVSKAYGLAWWVEHLRLTPEAIVYAGDSGNDLAALTAGYRAIVVANADRSIAQQAYQSHQENDWRNRLYLAGRPATSGVLEGCRWFELVESACEVNRQMGATPLTHSRTHFRVWAPRPESVELEVTSGETSVRHAMIRDQDGFCFAIAPAAPPGSRYRYVLDGHAARPDPVSAYQPDGVHGPSQVVDHRAFPWTDQDWKGVRKRDLVIYELHVGAFTGEGTFRAAIERLEELLALGVTAVEIMPVAQSPGRWNWGYDGVGLFAVRNTFGRPDDFKALVDAAHALGLAVILDVVYNHLGPEGNYLSEFAPYFSSKHHTPWGETFNFDGQQSRQVRQFVVDNARFWLDEYHLDGLRLDAVHFVYDDSELTILDEIRQAATEFSEAAGRTVHLIAETNVYDRELLTDRKQRKAYDAIWCDCLMHSIYTHGVPELRLTTREFRGASDLAESLASGFVFAGREQRRVFDVRADDGKSARQSPTAHEPGRLESLVIGLQTHDSVGNHPHGKRIHQLTSKSFQKAAAGLTLLYPGIPLLFMGEESAVESPFPFFVDFEDPQLRRAVDEGRRNEFPENAWGNMLSPSADESFYGAKCHHQQGRDAQMYAWYRDLLALRKKGIAEGWLAATRLITDHNAKLDVFRLRYQLDDGGHVSVVARLCSTASTLPQPATLALEGSILISSHANPTTRNGHIVLQPNHTIILR